MGKNGRTDRRTGKSRNTTYYNDIFIHCTKTTQITNDEEERKHVANCEIKDRIGWRADKRELGSERQFASYCTDIPGRVVVTGSVDSCGCVDMVG